MKKIDISTLEDFYVEIIDRIAPDESLYGLRSRAGIFSPALTMWLMINGRLKGKRSLVDALAALNAGEAERVVSKSDTKRVRVTPISDNSGGLCRARARLSVELVEKVAKTISESLIEQSATKRWHGRSVFLCDGTTIALTRTQQHVQTYTPPRNQHGGAYTPLILCLCCHELFSGVALNPSYGAYRGENATSEQALFYRALDSLPERSLCIADRNFGIFAVAYAAQERGHEVLMRLTSSRARGFIGDEAGQEYIDKPVTWRCGSSKASEELGITETSTVQGRFIKWTSKRNGFRPLELCFFTNSSAPAQELADLYEQRERLENDIRTLKSTIDLERLFAETPDNIAKELMLGVAAYNLIRAIITEAANKLELLPRQISFTRALNLTQIWGNKLRDAASPSEKQAIHERFLLSLRQTRHPNRKNRRVEPRKLTYQSQRYTQMKGSRAEEQKNEEKILATKGHRGYYSSSTRDY